LTILRDVDLHIHCGEVTALIGPNGAGKTTLFQALLGLTPFHGQIAYTDAKDGRRRKPRIGYVPQSLPVDRFAPVTVMDFLRAGGSGLPVFLPPTRVQRAALAQSLAAVGAEALLTRRMGALSGGEVQRVLLALAISPPPDLLLLDEPVSGMDVEGLEKFYRVVDGLRRGMDMSILLITHDFAMVRRYADRVVLLEQTIRAQGNAKEVLSSPAFRVSFPNTLPGGDAL
jgi:zinc transport system ATP-binding protein